MCLGGMQTIGTVRHVLMLLCTVHGHAAGKQHRLGVHACACVRGGSKRVGVGVRA